MFRSALFPVYAPLFVLAVASFGLSPREEIAPPPDYTILLHDARYTGASPAGELKLSAGRIEYDDGTARLFSLQLSQQTAAGGRVVLHGESGEAKRGEGAARQFKINAVRGEITNGGRLLTLRAESVFYDTADGGLSGISPRIAGDGGELRGDRFAWSAKDGWRLEGNVKSVYWR